MSPKRRGKPLSATPDSDEPVPIEQVDPHAPLVLSAKALEALESDLGADIERLTGIYSTYREHITLMRDLLDGTIEPQWLPFTNASKVFIPLPKIVKDAAHSRIWATLWQQKEAFTCESSIQETDAAAQLGFDLNEALSALRRAVNKFATSELEWNLKEKSDGFLDEITTTGTAHVTIKHDKRVVPKKLRYDASGKIVVETDWIERDRVDISVVPVESCIWDIDSDANELRLFGYQFQYSRSELRFAAKQSKWEPARVKRVIETPDGSPTSHNEDVRRRERLETSNDESTRRTGSAYTLWEVYIRNFEVRSGVYADIVVTYHELTGQILRVALWQYIHNQMPVVTLTYDPHRNRPIARGAIEPVASVAAGVNAIANQTINSQTVRDNPGFMVPDTSPAHEILKAGWFPGIIIPYVQQGEVQTIEFSQTGNTTAGLALLDRLFQIAFQVARVGADNWSVGSAQRAPSSLGMSILQQSNELVDKVVNRFRVSVGRVAFQALIVERQTNPAKFRRIIGDADAALLDNLFTSTGLDHLRVTLVVTSATYSRELDRQNYLAAIQVVLGYERQLLELVKAIESPGVDKNGQPIPPSPIFNAVAMEVLRDTKNLVSRWLESFPNISDSGPYITDAAQIMTEAKQAVDRMGQQMQQLQAMMQAQGGMPGGQGGMPGAVPPNQPFGQQPGVGLGAGSILPV